MNSNSAEPPPAKSPSKRVSLPNFIQNRLPLQLSAENLAAIEAETRFSQLEIKRLYQQYRSIANKQNLLDESGFRESMGVLGMVQDSILCQRLFAVFNTTGSGNITFQEYAIGLNTLIKGTVDEKLTFAFAMTDLDGSGEITPEELEITVDSIMRIYCGIMGSANTSVLDRSRIRKMFNKLDKDKNGLITLQEYIRGMKAHPDFLSTLRTTDLFSVDQINACRRERSKVKSFKRMTKALQSDMKEALDVLEDEMSARKGSDESTIVESDSDESDQENNDNLNELHSILTRIQERLQSCREALDESLWDDEDPYTETKEATNVYNAYVQAKKLDPIDDNENDQEEEHYEETGALNLEEMREYMSGGRRSNMQASPSPHANNNSGDAQNPGPWSVLERTLAPAAKGSTVFFGHRSWDLVVNVMKGIQMAVGRSAAESSRPLNVFDFSVKEKYTLFASHRMGKSAKYHSAGQDSDDGARSCRFVDYAPLVFGKLREHFGIKNEDYVHSIGPGNMLNNLMLGSLSSLNELGSEGKSGSFFYFTSDGLFMVKTIHKEEHKLLRQILTHYYYHMTSGKESGSTVDSLLCRVVGCHVIRLSKNSKIGAEKIYFVVMTNTLHTDLELKRRFDLKGSSVGRRCSEEERANPKATLKDLDFTETNSKIRIGSEKKAKLMKILERDAAFLESQHIIDYSLLVGIAGYKSKSVSASCSTLVPPMRRRSSLSSHFTGVDEDTYVPFFQECNGGILSTDESEVYVLGIIDFLTLYTSRKRAERFAKVYLLMQSREGVSVQRPHRYKDRFVEFMDSIIE